MGSMRRSRLSHYKQDRLSEHFVSGSTARTAASLCGVNRKTSAFFFLRLREIIAYELEAESEAMFGGEIAVTILFSILFAIAANEPKPSFVVDERDRLIELRGMQAFFATFMFLFFAAMLALSLGTAPVTVCFLIVLAMFIGSVTDDITKLILYRRGL